jgi:hypothetical protein
MNQKTRTILLLIMAVLLPLLFAGCKGESSPTAPPPVTGTTPSTGGVTPPTGAVITLSVSNPNPLVNSISVITATVSVDGKPAPNGTAVEFTSNNASATFVENADVKVIKTTTNGVATATVTSTDVGSVTVTATVTNVAKSIDVVFNPTPVAPGPPPSTAPTISSVSPNIGRPTGGELIAINGTNFVAPVRVLFDFGGGKVIEGAVQSVTPTQITVLTPPIDLTTGQTQAAGIIVITQAGSSTEQRVTRASAFTFQLAVLTPSIRFLSPTSGPIDGGTRVTIAGDGFQAPVQVFFGSAQAQVVDVTFSEIIVISPTARDTAPNGSGAVTGPVAVKVVNGLAGTAKAATLADAFRYINKVQVTSIAPNQGPFTGGTRFKIDGVGFEGPVSVTLDGIAANIVSVNGSEIIGISNGIAVTGCSDASGPIVVTNINNGDSDDGPNWIYRVVKPVITGVSYPSLSNQPANTGAPSGTVLITVANPAVFPRITIGGSGAAIISATTNANGSVTYTVALPPTLKLDATSCAGGGSVQQATSFDLIYTDATTSCADTLPKGITISPQTVGAITLTPNGFTPFSAVITTTTTPAGPGGVPPASTTSTVASPAPQTIVFTNTGLGVLNITSATTTCANTGAANTFTVSLPTTPTPLNTCENVPIIARYSGSTSPGSNSCTITLVTDAGTRTLTVNGSSQ